MYLASSGGRVVERLAVDLHTFDQLCDAYCITYSCTYIAILYSVGQGRDDVGGRVSTCAVVVPGHHGACT